MSEQWTLTDEFGFANLYTAGNGDCLIVPSHSSDRFVLRMHATGTEHPATADLIDYFGCQSKQYGYGLDVACGGPLQAHMDIRDSADRPGWCWAKPGQWFTRYFCTVHGEMATANLMNRLRKQHFDATHTVADVPELLAIWADDADPAAVQLDSADEFAVTCPAGHVVFRAVRSYLGWLRHARSHAAQAEAVTSRNWTPCCNEFGPSVQEAARAELTPAGTSKVELMHHTSAELIFGAAQSGATLDDPALSRKWSVDILVGETLVIEYDGRRWHSGNDRVTVDTRKSEDLLAAGYTVVRLREEGLPSLSIMDPNYREITVSPTRPEPAAVINAVKLWVEAA